MSWKKWIPIVVIIILMVVAYFSGVTDYLTFDNLKAHREKLLDHIHAHPILSPVLYILLYIIVVALSLPGGTLLTLFGGFLFGVPIGTIYVVIGATIGATCIFIAAKTALGDVLKRKAGPFLSKMEKGFQKNVVSYLLFLRFIPLFPFWLVNLAPAFFQVRLWTYILTTFIGIIPGTYVYSQAGSGLGAIFDTGQTFSLDAVFNTQIKIALVVLGVFVLIPIFVKPLLKKYGKNNDR
ncbi:TVP38/TMEM64 family protein [Simkania sp.]|uniref:TVP38/TMEM64 family protein n=1 Tax=Simkania sp. TaxID=34094 RepID=UPI003B518C60